MLAWASLAALEDEWLWGWDETPGIVSVWAEADGRALVWKRQPRTLLLTREDVRFRPWLLLDSLADLQHLGGQLRAEADDGPPGAVTYEELDGPGALRFLVRATDSRRLRQALLSGAERRLGRPLTHLNELGAKAVLALPLEEQYLVASGRTYFKGLGFDDVRRLQFDLETSGLDADLDRIFLIALRAPDGTREILETRTGDDTGEAELLLRFAARVRHHDPDAIENHNLHGFDLPFLAARARRLRIELALARFGRSGFHERPAARGARLGGAGGPRPGAKRVRLTLPGRELIDSLDAVRRHDFSARDLPGHGLKAVARHLGLAHAEREYIAGARVYAVFKSDPRRVRRYASDDVEEAAGVSRLLGGSAFSLSQMAPRRYERLADAGAATGVLDPLLVRAYLRAKQALPAHEAGDGTPHQGAALHLFAAGVAERVVKADVASLYPSLMRQYRIGPARDRLGVLLTLVGKLVEMRLEAKAAARNAAAGSAARFTLEAASAAMKLVVNSAYGYLGAAGLTRFADVHAANEVTRRGRDLLGFMCQELAARRVQLLEADTDGVYFAVPPQFSEADERLVVAEVAALLPPLVELQFDGRYRAMLSHEPKNYALLPYEGRLVLRGVAFRSSRSEPYGSRFLREAISCLLRRDLLGVRSVYVSHVSALRQRNLATFDVTSHVRLTKTPEEYARSRGQRRELAYEALLAAGRQEWRVGERVHVYRRAGKRAGLWQGDELDPEATSAKAEAARDERDYDVEYYVRLLRSSFASRLERALEPADFDDIFADPEQPSLFARSLANKGPILTVLSPASSLGDQ